MSDLDALEAAERYRRAKELTAEAREQLIASALANRRDVNLRGLARRAGIYETTLQTWMRKAEANGGG